MAEDDANANDLATAEDDQSRPHTSAIKRRPPQETRQRPRQATTNDQKTKCRARFDQLAVPNRRHILALYQEHAEHLPRDKVERIKVLLQELYAMTPEETEKYLEHLKSNAREIGRRKDIRYMLMRLVKKRKKTKNTQKAYKFIEHLLAKSMTYAAKNPIPPLVSVRLRNLSNIILEQISDLRNVNMPNRDDPDPLSRFLIQVADWMAIAIEHLYYGVQLKKNKELEVIDHEAKRRENENKQRLLETHASMDVTKEITPNPDLEQGEDDAEAVISEPLLVSEME